MEPTNELERKARSYASTIHINQSYGGKPYTVHLKSVVDEVHRYKHLCPCDLTVMRIAGWLHDTIEDGTPNGKDQYKLLVPIFGKHSADIVFMVTNELGRNRKEQNIKTYPKIATSIEGKFLKLCDRLANVKNAIEEGSRMFDVYKEEQEAFQSVCRTYGEYDEMWDDLNTLLGES